MSQDDVSVVLKDRKVQERPVYTESGRLTVTTLDSNIELPSIINRQVPGAKLTIRSSRARDGKMINTYDIKLAGRRNVTLDGLVGAIASFLRGDGDALRKINNAQ